MNPCKERWIEKNVLRSLRTLYYKADEDRADKKIKLFTTEFIRKLAIFAPWRVSQSYELMIFSGVDPIAIEGFRMALLWHHGIPPSPYSVNHSVKSAHDLLVMMSGMDYILTCRFHGVVFAHLLNKRVSCNSTSPGGHGSDDRSSLANTGGTAA